MQDSLDHEHRTEEKIQTLNIKKSVKEEKEVLKGSAMIKKHRKQRTNKKQQIDTLYTISEEKLSTKNLYNTII